MNNLRNQKLALLGLIFLASCGGGGSGEVAQNICLL